MLAIPPILAAMVTPMLLYAGLGAMSVPIVIHLLNKRRYRRVRWAAIDFLAEAQRENRRRMRMQELILLALRCLAMGLIGLMLARLFVRPEALMAVVGSRAQTDRIILLDDSMSMRLQPGTSDGRVFDEAVKATLRLLDWLRTEATDDQVTILLASRPDRPLRSAARLRDTDPAIWEEELSALQPVYRGAEPARALRHVRELLDTREATINATVYVISDFQERDWLRGSSRPAGPNGNGESETSPLSGPMAPLAAWTNQERLLSLVLVDVGIDADNLCVLGIEDHHRRFVAGMGGQLNARIANFGRTPSNPTVLQPYVDEVALPPVTVPAIGPGQTIEVPIDLTLNQAGRAAVAVELERDALPADNQQFHALDVANSLKVLLVNGEPDSDAYRDEVYLLNVALRPQGPLFSGNKVDVIGDDALVRADLDTYDVVVLCNVFRTGDEAAKRLEAYVTNGGGLAVFLGDQVDRDSYNRSLFGLNAGLIDVQLGEIVSVPAPEPGARVAASDATHEVTRRFAATGSHYLADGLVWQYFRVALPEADGPADRASLAAQAALHPRVLLRLTGADMNPLLLETRPGRGRVWLWTTSADKEWNNLADQPVYVVTMLEMIRHLARGPEAAGERLVGKELSLAVDTIRFDERVMLHLPGTAAQPATPLTARPEPNSGEHEVRWGQTTTPGVYRFELRERDGHDVVHPVAVNVEASEGDVRRADPAALRASMDGLDVRLVRSEDLTGHEQANARRELWSVLLAGLAILLMAEQALAWWFGSRGLGASGLTGG